MQKNDNAHSIRMVNSLRKNLDDNVAKDFEKAHPLSKSANIEKKFEWAQSTCDYLEKNYDTNKNNKY